MDTNTGQVLNYRRMFSTQIFKSSCSFATSYFLAFFLLRFGQTGKKYFQTFVQLLFKACVTRTRVVDMMLCAFKSCPLEINSDDGL